VGWGLTSAFFGWAWLKKNEFDVGESRPIRLEEHSSDFQRSGKTIEILVLQDACWKKGQMFFQLVSNLFWVVKRSFVEPWSFVIVLPCLGWRSADFIEGFFCQKCLRDQCKHTRSSTKISMGKTNKSDRKIKTFFREQTVQRKLFAADYVIFVLWSSFGSFFKKNNKNFLHLFHSNSHNNSAS
jgi:hypothetical protein